MCRKSDVSSLIAINRLGRALDTLDRAAASRRKSATDTYIIARVMKRLRSSGEKRQAELEAQREVLAAKYSRLSKIGDRAGCKEAHQQMMRLTHEAMGINQYRKGSCSNG